jgi:hypothetical protein
MDDYVLKKAKMIFWMFEMIGWFLLISSIPFWFITKMPFSTVVLVIMAVAWIVGVRIDRKRILQKAR